MARRWNHELCTYTDIVRGKSVFDRLQTKNAERQRWGLAVLDVARNKSVEDPCCGKYGHVKLLDDEEREPVGVALTAFPKVKSEGLRSKMMKDTCPEGNTPNFIVTGMLDRKSVNIRKRRNTPS